MTEELLPDFKDEIPLNQNQNPNKENLLSVEKNSNEYYNKNQNDNEKEIKFHELDEKISTFSGQNKNFLKIIIPYNFKKNNYSIPDKEIEKYEFKDYVLNTLYDLNLKELFKFDSPYSPSFFETIIVMFPLIMIMIIIIYFLFILISLFLFNPITIYFSYKCVSKVYSIMSYIKRTLYEKFKKKAMKKILSEKNNSSYCKDNKIKWKLGLSSYWLELVKIQ